MLKFEYKEIRKNMFVNNDKSDMLNDWNNILISKKKTKFIDNPIW